MTWVAQRLADHCDTITKGTTPTSLGMNFTESGIPFVRVQNLVGGSVTFQNDDLFIDVETHHALRRSKIFPGDLLLSIAGTIGRCAIVPDDVDELNCNQAVAIIRPKKSIDRRFLMHWISSRAATDQISQSKVTATISNLSLGQIGELKIPLPPLEDQKRISAILDQADGLRRRRQRALNRLNQLSQAIFIEMFGEWDRPGANADTLQLGDHIDFLTSGSRGWAEYYSDAGGLFLRIQNVRRDELDLSDVAYVNAPATAEANRTRVQPGDVLLSITADLGRTAVVPEDIGEAYINQHLAIIRAKRFAPRFLSAALSSPSGQRLILKRNREGVKAGLNFDDVRSVLIPDVGAEREQEYAARANAVDCLKQSALAALAETEKLFASLQNRAFRGELTASSLKEAAA